MCTRVCEYFDGAGIQIALRSTVAPAVSATWGDSVEDCGVQDKPDNEEQSPESRDDSDPTCPAPVEAMSRSLPVPLSPPNSWPPVFSRFCCLSIDSSRARIWKIQPESKAELCMYAHRPTSLIIRRSDRPAMDQQLMLAYNVQCMRYINADTYAPRHSRGSFQSAGFAACA